MYNIKITSSVSSILPSLLRPMCVQKEPNTSDMSEKAHKIFSLLFFWGCFSPARNCFVVAADHKSVQRILDQGFLFWLKWTAQLYAPPWRKLSKPHLKFTVKCLQLHLLICQVTVTLAIRRAICASFLHSAELLVLVAQLPSLH